MRTVFVILSLGAALLAQTSQQFRTGQAARAVVGQPTFTAQSPGTPPSASILGASGGLAYANGFLVVADASRFGASPDNNRVLIYRDILGAVPAQDAEIAPDSGRCPICTGVADVVIGQKEFTTSNVALTSQGMRSPTAVATDGTAVAVADTDNNRVLIWRTMPTANGQPADVVLGQDNFTSLKRIVTDNKSFRGPQGVWIQNGRLFVADTQNHRVMVWNSIPSQNGAAADYVLGQSSFNAAPEVDLTKATLNATPSTMLNPVSVTSDGSKLFVTDLGHNRVLIFNSIPTRTGQAADVVVGQADFTTALANNAEKVCASTGTDKDNKPTYPARCGATLDFPRFALSDGRRLFIADGGNDRVLIFNTIPTANGQTADVVLGQVRPDVNNTSNFFADLISAADTLRTPTSLAFDGRNLYVADPFNRRVAIYTPGEQLIPNTGVRNAASREIFAVGAVRFGGTIKADDEVTLKIGKTGEEVSFKYKIKKDDTFAIIAKALFDQINAGAGDPNVLATLNNSAAALVLTARTSGEPGNAINISTETSTGATITLTTSGATLLGGFDAAQIAPGTIVSLFGENLADTTASVDLTTGRELPKELAGVQVYFDGIRAPLTFVSPGEVRAQMPWEVSDATSVTAWIRTRRNNGQVTVSTAIGVPVIKQNPGIFAEGTTDPRPGLVYHGSSFAQATVSVDGSAKAGDKARIFINDRQYEYIVQTGDGLAEIRDGLVRTINTPGDPQVQAFAAGVFTRVRLRSRVEGPAGNGIPIRAEAKDSANADAAQVILSATNSGLCCANVGGSRVTEANPAIPGETIVVYATGLGLVTPTRDVNPLVAGQPYRGPEYNEPLESVSSLAGGRTANVIFARLIPGQIGIYEVQLELNSDMPTDFQTQLTIAQSFQVSNIVTLAIQRTDQ
ncbi:MAG: hypothetical protein K2X03_16450 [Bryobacteraceae bacterium]|nr:hypothetical protein [Bryobacteraceae bacterium]